MTDRYAAVRAALDVGHKLLAERDALLAERDALRDALQQIKASDYLRTAHNIAEVALTGRHWTEAA